jgi:hypothetical protein
VEIPPEMPRYDEPVDMSSHPETAGTRTYRVSIHHK